MRNHALAFLAVTTVLGICGCASGAAQPAGQRAAVASSGPATYRFVVYGDTRFTDPAETDASSPAVRRALVEQIAAERPAAVFIDGDLPWHGIDADYAQYLEETRRWAAAGIPIHPTLGNHEFANCAEAVCLERWWAAFPELRGRRWYSLTPAPGIEAIMLDSDASLQAGSEQRSWLEERVGALSAQVRFVLIVLHHPPVADLQIGPAAGHNPRPNERALAEYLEAAAPGTRARFVVVAGHVHNYERFARGAVTYLVSGGGGAHPYPVVRGADDLYQGTELINYHYLRFELGGDGLNAEMVRLDPQSAATSPRWEVRDRFAIR